MLVDSATVKAHKAAAGQKSDAATEALGRSRGSLSSKLYVSVDALCNCLCLVLTPGQQVGCTQLPELLASLPRAPGAVAADLSYDTNTVLTAVAACGVAPVIPARSQRKHPLYHDHKLYTNCNKVELFFGRLKEARFRYPLRENRFLLFGYGAPASGAQFNALTVHTPYTISHYLIT